MRKFNTTFLMILSLTALLSCDDVLEEDITNDNMQIISPTEGTIISGNTASFSWHSLDGADDYRIQILNNQQQYIVDSLVGNTSFSYILNPGNYQWRVKGKNFAYETAYTFPVNFSMEASDELSNQNIVLLTPSANLYTNNDNHNFTWNGIPSAETYTFEIIKNLNGQQTILQEPTLTTTSFNPNASTFNEDAEYIWKVKAVNATSETVFSQRSLFLDRESPNQPALVSPADQETTSTMTVTFNWTNGADTGNIQSQITNTIEIASDINFNTLIHTSNTINNSYQYDFTSVGTYYWRVIAKDGALNISDPSVFRTIIIE